MDRYLITGFSGFVSKHFLEYRGDLESPSWLAALGARNGDRGKGRDDFGKK